MVDPKEENIWTQKTWKDPNNKETETQLHLENWNWNPLDVPTISLTSGKPFILIETYGLYFWISKTLSYLARNTG